MWERRKSRNDFSDTKSTQPPISAATPAIHAVGMDRNPRGPGYRALRKGRCSIGGQTYLLTTTCHGRRPWFRTWSFASVACAALSEHILWRDSRLLCWVLMPDHLHALVELGGDESLSMLVRRLKAVTAGAVNQHASRTGKVWASGFHDRALRREETALAVARYVIGNPLRAKLATAIGDYPYWDAIWLAGPAAIL